jgi:hypothetical protein
MFTQEINPKHHKQVQIVLTTKNSKLADRVPVSTSQIESFPKIGRKDWRDISLYSRTI